MDDLRPERQWTSYRSRLYQRRKPVSSLQNVVAMTMLFSAILIALLTVLAKVAEENRRSHQESGVVAAATRKHTQTTASPSLRAWDAQLLQKARGSRDSHEARPSSSGTRSGARISSRSSDVRSIAAKLCSIDLGHVVDERSVSALVYAEFIASIANKIGASPERIGDVAVRTTELYNERSMRKVKIIYTLRCLDGAMPEDVHRLGVSLEEVAAAWVTLATK